MEADQALARPQDGCQGYFCPGVSEEIKDELNVLTIKRSLLSTRYSGEMDDDKAERLPSLVSLSPRYLTLTLLTRNRILDITFK